MKEFFDISLYQAGLDWEAVAKDTQAVVIKCSQGDDERYPGTGFFADPLFAQHMAAAVEHGIKRIGVYHYFTAQTVDAAQKEAKSVLRLIEPFRTHITYFVACDVESTLLSHDRDTLTACIRAFCETIKAGGYVASVYTNDEWLVVQRRIGDIADIPLWLAAWYATPTLEDHPSMVAWQDRIIDDYHGIPIDHNYMFDNTAFNFWCDDVQCDDGNTPNDWSKDAVEWASDLRILRGDERGLRLRDPVTREEMVVMLYRAFH